MHRALEEQRLRKAKHEAKKLAKANASANKKEGTEQGQGKEAKKTRKPSTTLNMEPISAAMDVWNWSWGFGKLMKWSEGTQYFEGMSAATYALKEKMLVSAAFVFSCFAMYLPS